MYTNREAFVGRNVILEGSRIQQYPPIVCPNVHPPTHFIISPHTSKLDSSITLFPNTLKLSIDYRTDKGEHNRSLAPLLVGFVGSSPRGNYREGLPPTPPKGICAK